jgi:hypothetical protein
MRDFLTELLFSGLKKVNLTLFFNGFPSSGGQANSDEYNMRGRSLRWSSEKPN